MIHEVKVRKRAPYRIEGSQTLQELVDSLGEYAEKTAFLTLTKHDQGRWSFAQLAQRAREFANGLIRAGVQRGESVVLFAENRPEWIAAAFGVIRAGAVVVPLDIQFGDDDLTHILADSEARTAITTERRRARLNNKSTPKERYRRVASFRGSARFALSSGNCGRLMNCSARATAKKRTSESRMDCSRRSRNYRA